jgi:WD40 repeat protein
MPSQTILHTFTDHTGYVRSGLVSPSNPALILTGSYDSTVRLWDTREGACVMTMRGGGEAAAWPVEDVLMFPSGSAALSASGPILRVWDLVAGGRCVRALSNHQKTVTALAFDGRAGRLLTGGLDQMVKVYDVSTYKVVHTMKYPAPVLSLAISVRVLSHPFNSILPLNPSPVSLMIPISQPVSVTVPYPSVDGNQKRPKPHRRKQSARLFVRTHTNSLPPVCWGTSESGISNRRRGANQSAMSTRSGLRVDERRNYASTTDY